MKNVVLPPAERRKLGRHIPRVILLKNCSRTATISQFCFCRHSRRRDDRVAPLKEAARRLFFALIFLPLLQSCFPRGVVVVQKSEMQRATSRCVFGATNFNITVFRVIPFDPCSRNVIRCSLRKYSFPAVTIRAVSAVVILERQYLGARYFTHGSPPPIVPSSRSNPSGTVGHIDPPQFLLR